MKRNKFVLAFAGIAAVGLAIFTASSFKADHNRSRYKLSAENELREANGGEEDARGAIDWLYNVRKNQVTGQLNMVDVVNSANRASASINASRNSGPMSTASASWSELGPDNVGGRTRAVHFDVLDATHQHMWAGGVGGGLWESTDGANNWHRCNGFFNVAGVYITVTTIAQGSDGALYVGTGEGDFYGAFSTGSGGLLGGGIYKSVDDGQSWALLSATAPTANSNSATWVSVNKIMVDPSNPSKIYAGMNKTLKVSTDGGTTWTNAPNVPTSGGCTDVDIASNGRIIATCTNKPWVSVDGGASFTNQGLSANGWLTTALSRTEIAIAPSDPSIVYAFCAAANSSMAGMLVSIDGGMNWTVTTGAGNAQFDPFNQSQGDYDNIVAVDPNDSHRAIFGGVELWSWTLSTTSSTPAGTWNRIALEFPASPFNPFYVHSDKHAIVFKPGSSSTFFIGTDGGIFRTLNGNSAMPTYAAMNKGYNVTQCYSVAPDMWNLNWALAGCQDNGTQYIDGLGNDTADASAVGGGDGGEVEISLLNPNAIFTTVYYGSLYRSNNRGNSSASFYSDSRQDNAGQGGFASFITPIRLWESSNDLLSGDTVRIINGVYTVNASVTDGSTQTFTGTLTVPVTATPAPSIVTTGALAICGQDTAIANAGSWTGDATGTINSNGAYSITWNTTPGANQVVAFEYMATFSSGTVFTVSSNVQGRNLTYTTPVMVNPFDTVKIQDVFQSHIAVGFSTAGSSADHGIWMTRRAIDFSVSPLWLKIGGLHSTPNQYAGEAEKLAWSSDGNMLFVSTSGGTLYRFDNLGSVTDSANGDVDHAAGANPTCQVRCHLIGNFPGRYICGLDVDPNDNGHVIVSLGNYGNTSYVYVSNTADTATSVAAGAWADKTGNLDNLGGCPVYSICFDKYTPNRVLAGTEHGVFETANISAATPTWAAAMTGLDNVAVFMIRQQRKAAWLVPNEGCFYLGTHGRGMWVDKSSWQMPTGIPNNNPGSSSSSSVFNNKDLKVYPNPVLDNAFVNVNLVNGGDVDVQIFDLNGKLLSSVKHENLNAGINNIQFGTDGIQSGTYLVVIMQNGKRVGTGRFLKMN